MCVRLLPTRSRADEAGRKKKDSFFDGASGRRGETKATGLRNQTFAVFVVRVQLKAHFAGAVVSAQRVYAELLASVVHRRAFVVLCKEEKKKRHVTDHSSVDFDVVSLPAVAYAYVRVGGRGVYSGRSYCRTRFRYRFYLEYGFRKYSRLPWPLTRHEASRVKVVDHPERRFSTGRRRSTRFAGDGVRTRYARWTCKHMNTFCDCTIVVRLPFGD